MSSTRVILSYFLDWIIILVVAGIGAIFNHTHPKGTRHAFSLTDPTISYPIKGDTVRMMDVIYALICGPALITFLLSIVLVPGPTVSKVTSRAQIWRRRLWEWNAAWMGLALSLASAFVISEGLKIAAGRPRPHLLAVCQPDTSPESIAKWRVGGLENATLENALPLMVTWEICTTQNTKALNNAFKSWPSGHSSTSWAGFLYLTLWICAKTGVHIPFLPSSSAEPQFVTTFARHERHTRAPPRNKGAAPPLYLALLAAVPVGAASYVAVSRWFDYHHHPFDIISGTLIGIACAWFSFRLYQLPIQSGSGWAWGTRSKERAFWRGIGRHNYVGETHNAFGTDDIEDNFRLVPTADKSSLSHGHSPSREEIPGGHHQCNDHNHDRTTYSQVPYGETQEQSSLDGL